MVELAGEDVEALGHGLGEVLVVLEGLHDADLGGECVSLVLDGEADGLVDTATDVGRLHVLFVLGDVVYGTDYATGYGEWAQYATLERTG